MLELPSNLNRDVARQGVTAMWSSLRILSGAAIKASIALSRRGRKMENDAAITKEVEHECNRLFLKWKENKEEAGLNEFAQFYESILRRAQELLAKE